MGSRSVQRNRSLYRLLVGAAQRERERSSGDGMGLLAVAAAFATSNCVGVLYDQRLEETLARLEPTGTLTRTTSQRRSATGVLHVATTLHDTGGHTRLLQRWIALDEDREHSVFLTGSRASSVPQPVLSSVKARNGEVRAAAGRSAQQRARELREAAQRHRYVVLHVNPPDPVPSLAFGPSYEGPPVLFVDHADHLFWLAPAATTLLVTLRSAGERLARTYRNVSSARTARLPIPLEPQPPVSDRSRAAAKHALGIHTNDLLILTCAAAYKYRSGVAGLPGFTELIAPFVRANPRARLIAIGPGGDEKAWAHAARQTGGRMRAVGVVADTTRYRTAADLYVDSFPFGSGTSLLESAARGTPAMAFQFPEPELGVFSVGDPRLEGVLPRASSPGEFGELLARLLGDDALRIDVGRALERRFGEGAGTATWREQLENVYRSAESVTNRPFRLPGTPRKTLEAFDRLLADLLKQYRPGLWSPLVRNRSLFPPSGQRTIARAERAVAAATKMRLGRRHADAVGSLFGMPIVLGRALFGAGRGQPTPEH